MIRQWLHNAWEPRYLNVCIDMHIYYILYIIMTLTRIMTYYWNKSHYTYIFILICLLIIMILYLHCLRHCALRRTQLRHTLTWDHARPLSMTSVKAFQMRLCLPWLQHRTAVNGTWAPLQLTIVQSKKLLSVMNWDSAFRIFSCPPQAGNCTVRVMKKL